MVSLPGKTSLSTRTPLLVLSYLFPLVLSLAIVTSIIKNERVVGMSWEFAEYGSIARNILRGDGAVSGAFEPYDLALLKGVDPRPTPPIAVHNRTLLPMWLTAASVWLLGDGDLPVMLPHILMLLVLVFLTNHLERRLIPGTYLPFAAVLVACTPIVFASAIQCYPNVLFAALFVSFLWLVFRVAHGDGSRPKRRACEYVALGLLAGLAQLARSDFAISLPFIILYFFVVASRRAALGHTAAVLAGWLSLNAFEWSYALQHYQTPFRSETFWTNLANLRYENTWLYYIDIDRLALLREHWATLAGKTLRDGLRLAIKVAVTPVRHFGLGAGALALGMVVFGLVRTTPVVRAAGHLKALAALGLIGLCYVFLFALLRPNTRYFIWTLPFLGILMRCGIQGVADTFGAWRGWRTRGRLANEWAVLLALIPLCVTVPARAVVGTTRHYVNSPTAYYSPTANDSFMRQLMESSLIENYPYIRRTVPVDAVVMTDEPAVHWYTDRLTMFLPMDLASIAAIERDWFPLRYLYLGPTMWFKEPQPLGLRYRHYLAGPDGTVPESLEAKLEAFQRHLPNYSPIWLFGNGGVFFARRGEVPPGRPSAGGGEPTGD